MDAVLPLLAKVDDILKLAGNIVEECYRLTVTGEGVSKSLAQFCVEIESSSSDLSLSGPIFRINGTTLQDAEEFNDYLNIDPCSWTMVLNKSAIISLCNSELPFTDGKENLLYFSEEAALQWVKSIDPFATDENELSPSFDEDVIIWIANSQLSFGGSKINVLPFGLKELPEESLQMGTFPLRDDVNQLVKVNANKLIRIRPDSFFISWGDKNSQLAKSFMLLSIKSLIACISYELKKNDNDYSVTLKGTKSIIGSLNTAFNSNAEFLQGELIKTVRWIYTERNETRQQLVMDRLSLDMVASGNFYEELCDNLPVALQQSQDSYAFVILDRKDAYHKEMRELLKDMRSQADMYASKVRDIVNNITRDMLGVFAFVGYSFLGKFDKSNLTELINSHELALLVKFLSGYLILSCVMQLIIHLRDTFLTSDESVKWLKVLQRYTSREENTASFLEPIQKRKRTLYLALVVMSCIYLTLAICIYKLPKIVVFLLA